VESYGDEELATYSFVLRYGNKLANSVCHKLFIKAPVEKEDVSAVAALIKEQLDLLTVEQLAEWVREIERYRDGE